ncbi:MAG: transglutaminase domain-containing protein [Deltaproteobacteria bacterium]|nr:transglutaminase domain-containing protein [Deltaproteobacteria bacterium]
MSGRSRLGTGTVCTLLLFLWSIAGGCRGRAPATDVKRAPTVSTAAAPALDAAAVTATDAADRDATVASADAGAAARESRFERLTLYIAGQRVGHFVSIDRLAADGEIELVRQTSMKLRRGTTEIDLDSTTVTRIDRELRPLGYSFVRDDGQSKLSARGEVRGDQIEVTTTAGGATTARTVVLEPGTTLAAALEVRCRQRLRDGDQFTGRALLEELGALVDVSYRTRQTAGGFVVESTAAGIAQTEHLDAQGRTVRIEIPALGAYAVPEGAAPPPLDTPLDVLARTVWPAPPDLPARDRLAAVTFRVEGTLANPVPEDRRQRVLERSARYTLVRVERAASGAAETLTEVQRRDALAETPYEAIRDPRIVAAATRVTAGASSGDDKVAALARFVDQTVAAKDLTRAYAPATETLESGAGDCTEHAVLFSALAKASGIPTRLVDGVVVADGRIGYHEWVEVFVEGEGWRPVDPTFGEPIAGPNRLKLAVGSSQPEELLRMGLSAAGALTDLKISVVAHERLGQ